MIHKFQYVIDDRFVAIKQVEFPKTWPNQFVIF